MVPIGNICRGNFVEQFHEPGIDRRRKLPHCVTDSVRCRKIVQRLCPARIRDDCVYRRIIPICQKRRPGMGRKRLYVASAVVLLVAARLFVLLQNAGKIFLCVEGRDYAGLGVGAHRLAICIKRAFAVLHKRPAGDERVKRLASLAVSLGRRAVRAFAQIDFGARYMKETLRIAGRKRLGFCGVYHVIRNGRDLGRVLPVRPDGRKRSYVHLDEILSEAYVQDGKHRHLRIADHVDKTDLKAVESLCTVYETDLEARSVAGKIYKTGLDAAEALRLVEAAGLQTEEIAPVDRVVQTNLNSAKGILDIIPEKLNAEKNTLIIIHLMGSHTKYRDRYPREFNSFSEEAPIINEYDNSIYYTDYVIDKFFRYFSVNTNLKFFGYFSDHGADPRQMGNDHNTTHFVFDMVRIPFVAGFSDKYLQENTAIASTLSDHTGTCFTNDLIFDFMLAVMGLTSSNYYHSSYDLSSDDYSISMENARTLLGEKMISEDPEYDMVVE